MIGSPFKIKEIELDNVILDTAISYKDGIATFLVTKNFTELHIIG